MKKHFWLTNQDQTHRYRAIIILTKIILNNSPENSEYIIENEEEFNCEMKLYFDALWIIRLKCVTYKENWGKLNSDKESTDINNLIKKIWAHWCYEGHFIYFKFILYCQEYSKKVKCKYRKEEPYSVLFTR